MPELETQILTPETDTKTDTVICFVCTGNTCRSPMAAAIFNHLCIKDDTYAISAGLSASGQKISKNAVSALNERGVFSTPSNDYINHISRQITPEIMEKADIIVGISSSHAMMLMGAFPEYAGKIISMPHDISDPFGGDIEIYKTCLGEIEAGIRELFSDKIGNQQ